MQQLFRIILGLAIIPALFATSQGSEFHGAWPDEVERVWVGPQYWANPLQDWRVRGGRLECIAAGGDRNVFLLTRAAGDRTGDLAMSVKLGRLEDDIVGGKPLKAGWVGFRVGVNGSFNDYRDSAVRGFGLNIGMSSKGRLFIGKPDTSVTQIEPPFAHVELRVKITPSGGKYKAQLEAFDSSGKKLSGIIRDDIGGSWLAGGLALVCSSGEIKETPLALADKKVSNTGWGGKPGTKRGGTVRFWFKDWKVSGSKIDVCEERAFGPILFCQHTLSRGVLKMTVQMPPVGNGSRLVKLQVRSNEDKWKTIGGVNIDPMARTATFGITDWDDTRDVPYRVVYTALSEDGADREYYYHGTVGKDPTDKEEIVVAAFTGNGDYGFPHQDIVKHVSHLEPDMLAFTGDQIYEAVGEYGIQRKGVKTATLDYLRKWYIFGWGYQELLKDIPSVCLPDDHDVYHSNIWGAGGRHATSFGGKGQDQGGYTMDATWVNMVQRTQTSHHPDPYDPKPVEQGISVYYGPLHYGGVSFAIIEDRKWKSAPKVMLPQADIYDGWSGKPNYDAAKDSDVPGAVLLGKRQLDFLDDWAADWSDDTWMKVVISQTIFANVATLPKTGKNGSVNPYAIPSLKIMQPGEYAPGDSPVMDHDTNGWPQTPRNNALRIMRKCFAFHIAGDQHLGSTIQYGIDEFGDAGFAICVPSVSNLWPRRWFPSQPGGNHKEGMPRYTGDYLDGFGNKMTVLAVSNPHACGVEPVAINNRAPGYGIITFNRNSRKITMANWPRWVDPTQPDARAYPGWPVTIDQLDNYSRKAVAWLPTVKVTGMDDPVVQVIDETNNDIVYTLRVKGNMFVPGVFKEGKYTIKVGQPETAKMKTFTNVDSVNTKNDKVIEVSL